MSFVNFFALLTLAFSIFSFHAQAEIKKNVLDSSYSHERWKPTGKCIEKKFRAYTSCFDDGGDNNGDGIGDLLRVPRWVAYQIKRFDGKCIPTTKTRPKWMTDEELFSQKIMADDRSYSYPKEFMKGHKDWFARGHLAQKMHAERMGSDAAWNTHIFFNAVPQRQLFNAGIWLDLEELTGAWAQRHGEVWIITGPIYVDGIGAAALGEKEELQVSVPDALYKIVVKNKDNIPDVMAFIYPQVGAGYYLGKPYDHTRYMTSIDEIEKLTGLDFFSGMTASSQAKLEKSILRELWNTERVDFLPACRSPHLNK